jgi:hypothetical protein
MIEDNRRRLPWRRGNGSLGFTSTAPSAIGDRKSSECTRYTDIPSCLSARRSSDTRSGLNRLTTADLAQKAPEFLGFSPCRLAISGPVSHGPVGQGTLCLGRSNPLRGGLSAAAKGTPRPCGRGGLRACPGRKPKGASGLPRKAY